MSFTCPQCGRTSHNPNDVREGYCGACHTWTAGPEAVTDPTTRLTNFYNALEQIKAIATLHYIGGAFDPEHMRTLAVIATDALNGREMPPLGEASDEVRETCIRFAEEYAQWVDDAQ